MSDLAEFLLARFAEDEAVAQMATKGPWQDRLGRLFGQSGVPGREILVATQAQAWNGDHITRWDPARVLAECEAKRRIVESARHTLFDDPLRRTEFWRGARDVADADLRFLALPYADHPDCREEWRP